MTAIYAHTSDGAENRSIWNGIWVYLFALLLLSSKYFNNNAY